MIEHLRAIGVGVVLLLSMSVTPLSAQSGGAITTDGMAGIRVGMTQRQIAHFLKPGSESNGCWSTRSGLMVIVERGIVVLVSTDSSRLATLSGARVGMSVNALRNLYPRRLDRLSSDHPYYDYSYFLYSSSGNGIKFGVNNGKITDISSGRRGVIDRESYCS